VFDYGCGRGDDIAHLQAQGIDARGWDPHFNPHTEKVPAQVVNLGYVVNVVEDPLERARALEGAWALATSVLVVAARIESEGGPQRSAPQGDGLVTRLGTFQKLFNQHELKQWVESVLGWSSVAAGPGVVYVFRDPMQQESFVASRFRASICRPRISKTLETFERYRELFEQLIDFLCRRGRPPHRDELRCFDPLEQAVGSLKRALLVVRRVSDEKQWLDVERQRRDDLLVYLALARFSRRRQISHLPLDIQRDIRAFLGSYKGACQLADQLLFAAGKLARLRDLAESSPVGKRTPSALYVHRSALQRLAPELRVYEGFARVFVGEVEGANIIKLNLEKPRVSYLAYPGFDREAHPALAAGLSVDFQRFRVRYKELSGADNRPILHRKELFVAEDYADRPKFERLTRQEVGAGLLENTAQIGYQLGWQARLDALGWVVRGHTLRRSGKEGL